MRPIKVVLCWLCLGLLPWLTPLRGCAQPSATHTRAWRNQGDVLTRRDSLALMFAIHHYAEVRWAYLGANSRFYDLTTAQITYRIDRAFYSPDQQRVIIWVSNKKPNASTLEARNKVHPEYNRICPTAGDTIVGLFPLIGLRSKDHLWELYFFNEIAVQCAKSVDQARPYLEAYFFKLMKLDAAQVYKEFLDPAFGGATTTDSDAERRRKLGMEPHPNNVFTNKAYGYNLQDPDFWTKSLLWQKGVLVQGLYMFQTRPGAKPGDVNAALLPPPVPYPESIRRLFR